MDFRPVKKVYDAIEEIGVGEMGLNIYPNQIEVITAEQMLDAYASIGMPQMYRHWSFGKTFAREEHMYKRGMRSLAYELVINSNPCINYIMEENSMTMQVLVLAHAAMGHNHFFKNNYLFKQWTRRRRHPRLSELRQALRRRVRGALWRGRGGRRARRRARADGPGHQPPPDAQEGPRRTGQERSRTGATTRSSPSTTCGARCPSRRNHCWRAPAGPASASAIASSLPEENILYFLEKNAPKLEPWKRELLRIVRMLAQYFYPQRQTKMMNEGCATFVHYDILDRMYEEGLLTEGSMLEFLHSHSSVVIQPSYDSPHYSRHQSLRAGLCHDARHQADVRGADGGGPGLVPGYRRQRRRHGRR